MRCVCGSMMMRLQRRDNIHYDVIATLIYKDVYDTYSLYVDEAAGVLRSRLLYDGYDSVE
jgi:hypothetical protein